MRRALPAALLVACAVLASSAPATAESAQAAKPQLELLTESQRSALRKQRIKPAVSSRHGERARVEATLVVGGYPSDYVLKLGRESARLRGGDAGLGLELSRRHREVLAFGAQACEPATLHAEVRAGGRRTRFSEGLRRPRRC